MPAAFRIGVDLGGTKIEAAALDRSGAVHCRRRVSTPAGAYWATIAAVADLVRGIERQLGIASSVGIGMPVPISPLTALVKSANSSWLNGRPLQHELESELGRPLRL